jgi:hypothetical protein
MGPVKRNAIAVNASRRLASDLQAPLRQNAVTPLKTWLRMEALLSPLTTIFVLIMDISFDN